jgi:ATP-dependent RNA helicase RhlE
VNSNFKDLALIEPIERALRSANYERPTPIQTQAIPHLLAGRDLIGIAQTGTGKTAAFALPILQRLTAAQAPVGRGFVRALVLTPTRELAIQIDESFRTYGRHLALRHAVIFGGVNQRPQVAALSRGLDILVATPGRLLDLMGQGQVRLDRLSIFVLDEADRMLDMGFIHDVRKIIAKLPAARQTLFFSATMPPEAGRLAASILRNPARVEVTPPASTVERVDQRVLFVDASSKRALLAEILKDPAITRALVFTRTKHGANRVAEQLERIGVRVDAIHGNKSQPARQRALEDFRSGATRVLVATDIAARGIDIDDISHVINYELPNVPESYVHRIGRTARAGAAGVAISFCDGAERAYLKDIEKLTRCPIAVVEDHPFHAPHRPSAARAERGPRNGPRKVPTGRARPGRGQPSWQRPAFARPQRRGLVHNTERS